MHWPGRALPSSSNQLPELMRAKIQLPGSFPLSFPSLIFLRTGGVLEWEGRYKPTFWSRGFIGHLSPMLTGIERVRWKLDMLPVRGATIIFRPYRYEQC